uniref:General transcription factor 3C polypeptide 2-like n=1 Tax=Phallusia mammillata TaxID=59560 RepID=A0A6F9DDH4_9ASCI|nr:general transcription factor 3C polypeptide 2-like [Phallusia mammillata]
MSSKRTKRRKTYSPRKVVSSSQQEEALDLSQPCVSTTNSPDAQSSTQNGFEAVPGDPKDLASYILQNSVINFVETPRLPEEYYTEISHVKLNTKQGEEMLYKCRGCEKKTYRSAGGLKAHVVNCPDLPKSAFTCVVCNEKFHELIYATDHIKDVHITPHIGVALGPGRRAAALSRMKINNYESSSLASDEKTDDYSATEDLDFAAVIKEEPPEPDLPMRKRNTDRAPLVQGASSTYSYLHIPLANAYEWTYNRLKTLESANTANSKMENSLVCKTSLTVDTLCDMFQFNPRSPQFAIDTKLLDKQSKQKHTNKTAISGTGQKFQTLRLFKALPCNKHKSKTFFTGAPVWSMAWCPYPTNEIELDQVLALCSHSQEHFVDPAQTYDEPVLLQLWNCGQLPASRTCCENPYLIQGFVLDGGPVWDMKWCPFGGFIQSDGDEVGRLGILALALGSGVINIVTVPLLQKSKESKSKMENIKRLKPSLVLWPLAGKSLLYGQCFSVSWSVNDGCKFIAGGFASGHVAIWDVNTESKFLKTKENEETITLLPFVSFRAHSKPVKGIAWCPFNTYILATAAADKLLKLWDRRRPECDLKDNLAPRTSIINEICWPHLDNGVYLATDSSFANPHSHGCLWASFKQANSMQSIFPTKACCFTVTHSDWLHGAAGGDASGNAMVMTCNNWNRNNHFVKKSPRMLLFQSIPLWNDQLPTTGDAEQAEATHSPQNDDTYDYKLLFHDSDMTGNLSSWENRSAHKKIRTYEDFADEVYRPQVSGVQKMRWNPNKSSFTWIASGTHSGLVRLHCVSGMISSEVEEFRLCCSDDGCT